MCFLIQSKQTKSTASGDLMTEKTHISVPPLKKMCWEGQKERKKKKKKYRNIVTNIQWTFLQCEICRCDATSNVDVILQSEVDQTEKINTIISHDPEWAGKHPVLLTDTEEKPSITPSLNVTTACWWYVLHPYEELLLSTFYFLLNPPGSVEVLFTLTLYQIRLWAATELVQPTVTLNDLFHQDLQGLTSLLGSCIP